MLVCVTDLVVVVLCLLYGFFVVMCGGFYVCELLLSFSSFAGLEGTWWCFLVRVL